jgi:hypothetical protein
MATCQHSGVTHGALMPIDECAVLLTVACARAARPQPYNILIHCVGEDDYLVKLADYGLIAPFDKECGCQSLTLPAVQPS